MNPRPDTGGGVELVRALLAASQTQARLAMELHADPLDQQNRLKAAVAAGVAVELALKASIASILPSLLAEKGDPHSQLYLMGRGGLPSKSPSDVRTIVGMATWHLVTALRPQLGIDQKDAQAVFNVRNGAAHLALVDQSDLTAAVRAMTICIDRLLPTVDLSRADYWGPEFENQVGALIKEVMDAREVRVQQAKSAALLQLARLKALGAEAFEAVVMALSCDGREPETTDDSYGKPHECPVCGHDGWLSGVVERGDLEVDDADSNVVWVTRLFVPQDFRCDLCGFAVWNQDLPLAGLPAAQDLEPDDDPWELRQLYEDAQAEAQYEEMRESHHW